MTIDFKIFGTPKPQGSKKAFMAGGKAMMAEAGGGAHAQWRNAVAEAAHQNVPFGGRLDGRLVVRLVFWFPMPASRPKAIKAIGKCPKTTAPDIDKLQRAVLDGLMAGGLIRDDATIFRIEAQKWETRGWTGCEVTIS